MYEENIYERIRLSFGRLLDAHDLTAEHLQVSARTLTPQESMGHPETGDYPLAKGKERLLEAVFCGAKGHAFSDMYGQWSGAVSEVLRLELSNNYHRAVFVASLNAIMRYLGLIEKTIHCRDDGPVRCAQDCMQMLKKENANARILLVGYQPRMLEQLSNTFQVNVVDMDTDNIGKKFHGITVSGPEKTDEFIEYSDMLLVTGTTLVNHTIQLFLDRKAPAIFYGVTIAGAAKLLGLRRFCPYGL